MRAGWLIAIAVCSCGKSKSEGSAAGSGAPPIAGAVVGAKSGSSAGSGAPVPAACPTDDALVAVVRSVRKLDAKLTVDARCAAGKFGEPGWYIAALVDRDGQASEHHGIVASDGKRELVAFESNDVPPARADEPLSTFEAHDLDGDGIDEIVEHWSSDRRGYIADGYLIHRLDHGALTLISGPRISSDDSAAQDDPSKASGCDAESEIKPAAKGKQIVVTVTKVFGNRDEDCLKPGKHVFTLSGHKLIEAK